MERSKCEEVIDQVLKGRIEDFRKAVELTNENFPDNFEIDGESYDDLVDWLNSHALALSKTVNYKLELSWGGPQDYFVFEYDPNARQLVGITYHFLDWFDGAKRRISPQSGEWPVLEQLFYSCILIE